MKAETVTLVLVNLAGIMERADESLLPGVYKEVGEALHADPTRLGSLTLFRSMVQSLCYPLAAYLAVRHNRAHVIAYGAFLWAAATFLVAFSSTFTQVAVSRALNGIGLAIVAPAIQSLVADSTDDDKRGMAFGWLQLTSNIGSIIGGLFSLMIAPVTLLGIPGWRLAFHLVGIISIIIGILVRLFANDPHFPDGHLKATNEGPGRSFKSEVLGLVQEAKTTGVLICLFVVGSSIGGLFGGRMGDMLSQRLPNCGRIILAQISSASAIPLTAILLLALPDNPSAAFMHGLVLFITGFCISWNAPATNNANSPIFAEIVPEKSRTSIYALDRSFESVLSSFAPPVVGLLAQNVYGYKPVPKGTQSIATDRENAKALAQALFTSIGTPMALCCVIYSFLYCTYPRDKARAQMEALIESELQIIGLDSTPPANQPYSQVKSSELQENLEDRIIVEMDYGEDELGFDDDDEKTLVNHHQTFSQLDL
uniref:Major facilitator superfamily (MFS) profile domain-containing protein n=1 Tax=Solanum lycopersicum TaxID=4081 RepID=A0A3Q7G8C0_SOLLC